ncbi:MAG: YegS/Rv2252/BmrU family lipid kinase [Armatimonadia bacterium]|nr:YegS/Rv2252/BmrU family lipid kinase [Armatimonadia bacterium]
MTENPTHSALIITNPQSGNGRGPELAVRASDALRADGWDAEAVVTEGPGDATRIARERAPQFGVVFSCGGDGTLNEVISGIVDHDVTVGVVPAGTANDLARTVGISLAPAEAIAHLTPGHSEPIDLLEIDDGDAWSAVAVGAGIDARTVQRAREMGTVLDGRAAYLAAVTTELGEQILTRMAIEVDDRRWEGDTLFVQVANCPNHGGGFTVAPGARIDDGLLDVVLVEAVGRARALEMIPLIYAGKHVEAPEVHRWRARRVRIAQPAGNPMIIDGEVTQRASLQTRIAPKRVSLWVPDQVTDSRSGAAGDPAQ